MNYNRIEDFTALDFMVNCWEETRYYDENSPERKVGAEFTHRVVYFNPTVFELCEDYKKAQDKAKKIYDALLEFAEKWFVVTNKEYKVNSNPYNRNYLLLVAFEMLPKGVYDDKKEND